MRAILLSTDMGMAIVFLILGYGFFRSNGKASRFIAGYNTKSQSEKQDFDETKLCRDYGKRIMLWAAPFIGGFILDYFFAGSGFILAWAVWIILLIGHVIDMSKNENRYRRNEK